MAGFSINLNTLRQAAQENEANSHRPKGNIPARQYLAKLSKYEPTTYGEGTPCIDLSFEIVEPEWVTPNGSPASADVPGALWVKGLSQNHRLFLEGKFGQESIEKSINKILAGFADHLVELFPNGNLPDMDTFMPQMVGRTCIIDVGVTKPTTKTRLNQDSGEEEEYTQQFNRVWSTLPSSNWHLNETDNSFPMIPSAEMETSYANTASTPARSSRNRN